MILLSICFRFHWIIKLILLPHQFLIFFSIKIIIMYFCSTLYTCEKIQFSNYHSLRTTFAFRFSYWNVVLQVWYPYTVFSSTKLKAQESFSVHIVFIVRLSVSLSVSVRILFTFQHLRQKNNMPISTQTWHRARLGKGNSKLWKLRVPLFFKGR